MTRLLLVAAIVAVALAAAAVARRRTPTLPAISAPGYRVPTWVDRDDFDGVDRPWLVAVFTSSTCETCARAIGVANALASSEVAVVQAEAAAQRELHQRYAVEAVPMTLVCDTEGAVRASFLGPVTAADLWATVAELREPGSTPPSCDHGSS